MTRGPDATATGFGILATALEKAVALGVALYLPRHHLGLEDYGRYTFVLSHLNLFQVLPDVALETALVTRLAERSSSARTVVGQGVTLRVGLSVLSGIIGWLALRFVSDDPVVLRAGMAWSLGLVATAANPFRPLLRAELRMARYLALISGQVAVALGCLAWVVARDGGVPEIMLAIGAGNAFGLGFGWVLTRGRVRFGFSRALTRQLFGVAVPIAATALVLLAAQQWLLVSLLWQHGVAASGLVGGSQKVLDAVNVLSQAVMVTLLPALAAASARSTDEALAIARAVVGRLVLVLAPITLALVCWPEPALVALFGDRLRPAAEILRVSAATVILHASGAVLTNLLVPFGRQRLLFLATALSATATLALGVALVPAHGGVGMGLALVGGMAAGQLSLWMFRDTRIATAAVWRGALAPLAFAIATSLGVVWLGGTMWVFFAVYLVGALAWVWRGGASHTSPHSPV